MSESNAAPQEHPSERYKLSHEFYTGSYPDLARLSPSEARSHFDRFGFGEGRYCSPYHYLATHFPSLRRSFSFKEFLLDNPEYAEMKPLAALEKVGILLTTGFTSDNDKIICSLSATQSPIYAKHGKIWDWVAQHYSSARPRVLEIGSRAVCSDSMWKLNIPKSDYTGFDVMAGKNVDVVGDAHKLSDYFAPSSFDLVVSFAVFEHLAMPWIVAEEISSLVKIGGHVVIETHFSFSEHELPWHFFQFNSNALKVLFNSGLGFTVIDAGHDNPIVGRFSSESTDYLRGRPVASLYCHSSLIAQKTHEPALGAPFNWRAALKDVINDTMYPAPM
jgi:hypothetical protein